MNNKFYMVTGIDKDGSAFKCCIDGDSLSNAAMKLIDTDGEFEIEGYDGPDQSTIIEVKRVFDNEGAEFFPKGRRIWRNRKYLCA